MTELTENAIRIAKLAGAKIKEMRAAKSFTGQLKYGLELVTSADIAANEIIIGEILKVYPSDKIISEESVNDSFSITGRTWVIDPIDGTVSYANNQYQVAVSIAFALGNQVEIGVVYNPFLDELFYAEKGDGAFLNGERIHVKEVHLLSECLIATGFPYKKDNIANITLKLTNLLPEIRDIRRLGSAALDMCWVACGRLQGYYEGSLSPWDLAAALLIAKEAGAATGHYAPRTVTSLQDDICGENLMVSSPGVFKRLKEILEKN
jgi:myo-inositol-1(or 4)-monophosphatase